MAPPLVLLVAFLTRSAPIEVNLIGFYSSGLLITLLHQHCVSVDDFVLTVASFSRLWKEYHFSCY